MADVENLFREYVAAHRSGGDADPLPYLDQVQATDREELAALIDGYLARAPGRSWDAATFSGSRAELAANQIVGEWQLEAEGAEELQGWRELLPALRSRAQVKRREGGASHAEAMRQVAFARTAVNDPRYAQGASSPGREVVGEELADLSVKRSIAESEQSDVDRLFTGGPEAG
jgi:hypothetical protein